MRCCDKARAAASGGRSVAAALAASLLVAAMLAAGCSDGDGAGPSTDGGWTILAYMAGNNNLDYSENINSFVVEDLQEMELVGSSDKLNIVAVISSLKNGGDANVYHIGYHPDEIGDEISSTLLASWGQKDMSDPQTLTDFLELGLDRYPADHVMLIIDDHGAGWSGACTDDPAGGEPMTVAQMKQAVASVDAAGFGGRFDLIVFHACLMASAEVAYGLSDVADYMVACQFVMPMESILNSDCWLGWLSDHTGTSAADLGVRIAQDVKACANSQGKICHMAVLDLDHATSLTSRVGDLGDALPIDPGDPLWAEVLDAWINTHTDYDDPATVDLRELVTNILNEPNLGQDGSYVEQTAQEVLDVINDMVIFTTTNAVGITRGGMNIYMPYQAQQWRPAYSQTAFAANNWDTFVQAFIDGIASLMNGTLEIGSTPAGAAITIDGEDTGAVTPATATLPEGSYTIGLTLAGYMPWTQTVYVTAGQTTTIDAQLVEEGGGGFVVQGDVTWHDQRPLTDCYVLLFEEDDGTLRLSAYIDVNEATGQFQGQFEGSYTFWIEFWDDVDGSESYTAGDGWNAVDADGDQQYPTWGDGVAMSDGHTYTIHATIYPMGGAANQPINRNFRPAGGGVAVADLAGAEDVTRR